MADPLNTRIGQRLRQRRLLLGMTQMALGKAIGLTFQSIQKYETGENGILPHRLVALAKALAVPVSYFFDQAGDAEAPDDRVALVAAGTITRLTPRRRAAALEMVQLLASGIDP